MILRVEVQCETITTFSSVPYSDRSTLERGLKECEVGTSLMLFRRLASAVSFPNGSISVHHDRIVRTGRTAERDILHLRPRRKVCESVQNGTCFRFLVPLPLVLVHGGLEENGAIAYLLQQSHHCQRVHRAVLDQRVQVVFGENPHQNLSLNASWCDEHHIFVLDPR